ncbi:conserved hypothetical protein [Burkholderia pseudomallei 305]|nr:conserved hypothetical protein [Burkholderia pseudomallei 305]
MRVAARPARRAASVRRRAAASGRRQRPARERPSIAIVNSDRQ